MNKNTILFFTLLVFESIFGQTKLQNQKIERNQLKLVFNSSLNYSIRTSGNKKVFYVKDFQDESLPGDVKLPSNDIFISLPKVENPKISYSILSKNSVSAIPEFNDVVKLNGDNELIYSKAKVIKNTKNSHFKLKGYLWIGNSYCMHIEVTPAIFLPINNSIEIVNKFVIELQFSDELSVSTELSKKHSDKNSVISNSNFEINDIQKKYSSNLNDSWIDYTKKHIKIGTAEDGIYRVDKSDIEKLGVTVASINPKTFRLILNGKEIPIFVRGESDLSFDSNDYVEFVGTRNMGGHHRELSGYGEPYNEYLGRYTDTTVYWLTWGGIQGKRVSVSNGNEVSATDTLDYYSKIEHYEKNKWFDYSCASQVRRENPFWIENKTWVEGGIGVGVRNKPFTVSNLKLNKDVNAFVKLQDWASNTSSKAHHFALSINSNSDMYDSTYVDKYEKAILHAEFSSNLLSDGANTLKLHSFATAALLNNSFLDWYEIEYPRYLIPINNSLSFFFSFLNNVSPKIIKLQNVTATNYEIWQYGQQYKKYNVAKVGNNIHFADSVSINSKFLFADESEIKTPKIYYLKEFVNLRSVSNNADYIIIYNNKFRAQINEYSQFIAENYSVSVKTIDIFDIYDEFGFGFFNPEVIKDFLISTHLFWQNPKPQNVVLFGGATYDYYGYKYKNFSSVKNRVLNYVPSYGAPVSDNWFVIWDSTGAYIPQMNIGRIPITTNEEFDWYFQKHKNYLTQESDEWNKRYLFFSGGKPTSQSQLDQMRESNQYVIDNYVNPKPIGGKAEHFYKTNNPSTSFGPYSEEYIQNAIDDGGVFISYLGHSGTRTWDNSITRPIQLKNNINRYPIVSDFGCSTGKFAEPDVVSFSQLFTVGSDGQALGYVGNSSLGFVSTSLLMPKLFYKKILKESVHNVSEAHKLAKLEMLQTYGSTGIYKLFALTNTLIGDPILSLPIPEKPSLLITDSDISTVSSAINDLQDSVKVLLNITNLGKVPDDTFEVLILHQYELKVDSISLEISIPKYSDTLEVAIFIKKKSGTHILNVELDPQNKIDEIYEDDNRVEFSFYVAATSIRPLLQYSIENKIINKIEMLNPSKNTSAKNLVLELSENENFTAVQTIEKEMDSLLTLVDLNLTKGKRYWGRTKLKGSENTGSVFSFYYSENIKFSLIDSISMKSGELINLKNDGVVRIDSTKSVFELFSAGFSDGNTALIEHNGVNYIPEATIAGHHVVLFDVNPPNKFVEYHYFNVYAGGHYITDYVNFLDTLSSNYLVAIAISDEGSDKMTTELRSKLKTLGSVFIDSINHRASWAFIGRKGAASGTLPEAYSNEGAGAVAVDSTIIYLPSEGSFLTSEIGRTTKWDKLVVSQETPSNSAITYTPIGIKANGVSDTLIELSFQDSVANLSHINSEIYPSIKILANFKISDDKQSPVLKFLGADYDDVAELAINYQVVSVEKDSITQGEKNKLTFFIYNVGETKADSVTVKVELHKPDNSSLTLTEFVTAIDSSSKEKFEYDFEILNSFGFGDMAYSITIDEDKKIIEFFEDNNFFQIPFYVKKDTSTGINDSQISKVTFDEVEIMDWKGGSDFVSNNPTIVFKLSDKANQANAEITLDNVSIIESVDYDSSNKTYSFKPELGDGTHHIYFSIPLNGISDEKIDTLIDFTVSNELQAKNIYNYPNPATDETYFTFRLSIIPETLDIKIYTVAGRMIKTLEFQNYDLRTGINKKHWDLRDQDDDEIANGVYLYKIILKDKDKVEFYTKKLAIVK